jgi:hypothetical protein
MTDTRARTLQRALAISASIVIVGLALVGTHSSAVGGLIVVLGMLALMWSVHSYGRLGPEETAAKQPRKRR